MSTDKCPWCDKPKRVARNLTCGDRLCKGAQAQKTKQERNNFNYTERPFGYLMGTKISKPFSTPGKPGGDVVEKCVPCKNIKDGKCRLVMGDLNNQFRYGDCRLRG